MNHNAGIAAIDKLTIADITIKTSKSKKPENLLELLENNELDVFFNGYNSIGSYKEALMLTFNNFKKELAELDISKYDQVESTLQEIKNCLYEVHVLLNPKDEDLLLAHVVFHRPPRFIQEDHQLNIIKKKH
jgi:hypothetical protein